MSTPQNGNGKKIQGDKPNRLGFLANWLSAPGRLLLYEEYSGAFGGSKSRHLSALANKFLHRGRQFFLISIFLLAGCGFCIVLGVATFLRPTYFTDVAKSEDRLKELQQMVADNLEQQRQVESRTKADQEYKDALAPFRYLHFLLKLKLDSYEQDESNLLRFEPPKTLGSNVLPYLQALHVQSQSHTLQLDSNRFAEGGPQQIGKPILDRVRAQIEQHHGTARNLLNDLSKLAVADNEETIREEMKKVDKVVSSLDWVTDEFNEAGSQLRLSQEAEKEFLERKFELMSQNAQLGLESAKIITEQVIAEQRNAWERWAPVLSIRVGVVILFLFLTRILLETYRYTTALSAFYKARGDALQMIGEGTPQKPIEPENYAKLLLSLAPENYRIDKIESPDNTLIQLLQPGVPVSRSEKK